MDGLNSIDDDLTDFINQIANSNDSDSPPGSAQSSSDSNSVRQLELLETIETKAVLPPCQVCGGNSSGFHFGAVTCEACKLFFRRSRNKDSFKCIIGRNTCKPSENSTFLCKLCRLKKCFAVGMSTDKVVRGRYAHKVIKEIQRKEFQPLDVVTIPPLLSFSDVDDLIIRNSKNFYSIRQIKWFDTLPNLHDTIHDIKKASCRDFYSMEDYLEILETTGQHIDDRRIALELIEDILETAILRFLPFVKQVPGMNEVKKKDFFRDFLCSGGLVHLALCIEKVCTIDNQFYIINLNGCKIVIELETAEKVISKKLLDFKRNSNELIQNCKLTDQEFSFICALDLLSPSRNIPELRCHHERMVAAFIRYLTTTYGKDYIRKFQAIIALMSHYNQCRYVRSRVIKRGDKYFDMLYRKPLVKAVYGLGNIEEHIKNITSVNIPGK